jgi:hypothetical protein
LPEGLEAAVRGPTPRFACPRGDHASQRRVCMTNSYGGALL